MHSMYASFIQGSAMCVLGNVLEGAGFVKTEEPSGQLVVSFWIVLLVIVFVWFPLQFYY